MSLPRSSTFIARVLIIHPLASPAMVVLISGFLAGWLLPPRSDNHTLTRCSRSVTGIAWSLVYRQTLGGTISIVLRMIFRQSTLFPFRASLPISTLQADTGFRRLPPHIPSRRHNPLLPYKPTPPIPFIPIIDRKPSRIYLRL